MFHHPSTIHHRLKIGLSRYDAHEEESEIQPSADLRIAADMKSIGQEYGGKRVSRKALAATLGLTAGEQACILVVNYSRVLPIIEL